MKKVCPLCKIDKELVSSHIVPHFFWKHTKENGQYNQKMTGSAEWKKGQSEPKEHLLCKCCDNVRLREFEAYLSRFIYIDTGATPYLSKASLKFKGIDYSLFKRAILSIFWRVHHSKLPEFRKFELELEQEELIRSYLTKKSELREEEFPIIVVVPLITGNGGGAAICGPYQSEFVGAKFWSYILQGVIYTMVCDKNFFHPVLSQLVLKSSGDLEIHKRDFRTIGFLKTIVEN